MQAYPASAVLLLLVPLLRAAGSGCLRATPGAAKPTCCSAPLLSFDVSGLPIEIKALQAQQDKVAPPPGALVFRNDQAEF